MSTIPKKTVERLIKTVGKFQKVLNGAKDRDVNEADTIKIIVDILSEVFGYDKYLEITSEFAIKGTYCDLVIKTREKIKEEIQYLIEVKAIGLNLKEQYIKQAVDYGAHQGVQWIVLTNGIMWEVYRIRFEKPIKYDLIHSINFLELNSKKKEDQETLFLLCRKGLGVKDEHYERIQCVNRFVISAIVLNDSVVNVIKRELKKMSSGLKVDNSEIIKILQNEVIKRDVLEGDAASKAMKHVKKSIGKSSKKPKVSKPSTIGQSPTQTVKVEITRPEEV